MKILVVEDEFEQRQLIAEILQKHSAYEVAICSSAEKAIAQLQQIHFDLVLSDWKLPKMDGLTLLQTIKRDFPQVFFVLMTAYGSISHAVSSMRAGADDYIAKPFEKEQLLFTLSKIENTLALQQQNQQLKAKVSSQEQLRNIIGQSSAMQKLFAQIERLANADVTVLIHGESGTGKELVAQTLFQESSRRENNYLAVNCSAIPESLAEAELFGSEKGAYTGADQLTIGKIEAANNGVLFLDEIAELPLSIQAKLLRFLQEGKIMRVGAHQEIDVDVRVIAATHKSLTDMVQQGLFREDLYYRLNVISLSVPPLRQRLDDLPALVEFFIKKFADKHRQAAIRLDKSAYEALYHYPWPGNIRELSNLIERLTVMHSGETLAADALMLTPQTTGFEGIKNLPEEGISWEDYERSILQQALMQAENNRTKAAKLLGLNYKAFLYRLEKYAIK
ncbi:MAG: sigma-54-dependent Fis family transcriptional regulator [Gammaproteobacteria bacterium]|nr:sigma-54-dependent Fis family transcriptional regulator [Gammaproteobacteria bacterium]